MTGFVLRSFDEEGSGGDYNNYGRNRGGRGGRGGGGNNKRVLSPEAAAVNAALASATSWRQLNTILEQQVCTCMRASLQHHNLVAACSTCATVLGETLLVTGPIWIR